MSVELFEEYFRSVYGDRFDALYEALKRPSKRVMRLSYPELHQKFVPSNFQVSDFPNAYEVVPGEYFKADNGLLIFYIMDPASMLVASNLRVTPGMHVLDMCSAPGGKGLIVAEKLKGVGEIFLNEFSESRRRRLTQVVRDYVPSDYRNAIFVKGKDGSLYGLSNKDYFDAILIDAPCSGEQHLVQSPEELDKWTIKRTKRLAQTQYSMLCSGLLAAKDGAEIIYSTCSISPLENDGVLEKLVKKKGELFEFVPLDLCQYGAEKTEYGYIFLPDKCSMGPMFCSKLKVKKS